jgi:hypothetical protein
LGRAAADLEPPSEYDLNFSERMNAAVLSRKRKH